jgi:hypothetical protein
MKNIGKVLLPALLLLDCHAGNSQDAQRRILERAAKFELKSGYKPVPGDALSHHTAGYAKTLCSAVFITGLAPEFAEENVGYFTGPYAERARVGKPVIDYNTKSVSIRLPSGLTRTAICSHASGS